MQQTNLSQSTPTTELPERRRFNPWLETDDYSWTSKVYEDCFPLATRSKHRPTHDIIVTNLAVAPEETINIFIDKHRYTGMKKPQQFAPTPISEICRVLATKGYLELTRGYSYEDNAEASSIRATDKLIDLIPDGLRFRINRQGLIVPKDFTPPAVYPPDVQEAEDVLYRYNDTVEPWNMLYATYKDGFDVNGRFTGSSVICMKKELRRSIRIDGEETFEADVKNCIPSLLYAMGLSMECPGDAYEINGIPRDLAKRALLICLNCYTELKAVRAIRKIITEEYSGQFDAGDVVNAVWAKHVPIQDHFFTAVGLRLMNLESRCMRHLMAEMLDEGVKLYPIYDSVIAKQSDRDIVVDAFTRSFTVNGIPPVIH